MLSFDKINFVLIRCLGHLFFLGLSKKKKKIFLVWLYSLPLPYILICLCTSNKSFQGRKMSKTLGNVIDPIDTIKDFGTDALRFTLALGTPGQVCLL